MVKMIMIQNLQNLQITVLLLNIIRSTIRRFHLKGSRVLGTLMIQKKIMQRTVRNKMIQRWNSDGSNTLEH